MEFVCPGCAQPHLDTPRLDTPHLACTITSKKFKVSFGHVALPSSGRSCTSLDNDEDDHDDDDDNNEDDDEGL